MYKIAAIIGGVLLMAGVALGGTVTSIGSTDRPTLSKLPLAASTTATTIGEDDRGRENETRGRANEPNEDARRRENEAKEDLRGHCDETEHASDLRCTGVTPTGTVTTGVDDDRRGRNRGHDGGGGDHGDNSGRGSGESGHPGHGGDD